MRDENEERENNFNVDEFEKTCPKLPPHYEHCSFMSRNLHTGSDSKTILPEGSFEQILSEGDIRELFNSAHCLAPPYHVEV